MTLLEALIGRTWISHGVKYAVEKAFAYSNGGENILIHTKFGKCSAWPVVMASDIERSKAKQNIWQPEDIEIVWSDLYESFLIQERTIGERTLIDV